jgi:hypothetical protein
VRCNEGRHSVVVLLHLRDGRWTVPGQTICSYCPQNTRATGLIPLYFYFVFVPGNSLPFILFLPFSMASFKNVEFL